MRPFHVLFDKEREIEYKGNIITRYYEVTEPGEYEIKFTFVETNSKIMQAIVIHFVQFGGNFWLDGMQTVIPKRRFPSYAFWQDTAPKEFCVQLELEQGKIFICNGSDLLEGKKYCCSLSRGCAMRMEQMGENKFRVYCNDHEEDDDFDDLIFDMEIIKM